MDIRCKTCSKLFRIADEKIAGKGIRFKCSQCGEVITILKEDVERDRMAREAAAVQTTPEQAPQPAVPQQPTTVSQPQPAPHPAPSLREEPGHRMPTDEEETHRTQLPVQPPGATGLEDFDFSEPFSQARAAEQVAGSSERLEAFSEQTPAPEAGSEREQETSPGEHAAEQAFQFPTDIIADTQRMPVQEKPAAPSMGGPAISAGGAEREAFASDFGFGEEPGPSPSPEPEPQAGPFPGPASAASQADVEIFSDRDADLRAALELPKTTEEYGSSSAVRSEEQIHPLASGNITGAVAGIGCAIPVTLFLILGFGIVARFLPLVSSLPVVLLVVTAATGILSLGIVIGLVTAVVQAKAERKLFFLVNILIGTVFGAGLGAGMRATILLASGQQWGIRPLVADAVAWGALALVLSCLLAIARRIMVHAREETFSASLSGLEQAGLGISLAVVLFALYADGTLTSKMEMATEETAQQLQAYGQQVSPEGLNVMNARGYLDPANGDLVVTGTIENTADTQKPGWYLEIEVYDSGQTTLALIRMVNGVQIFSPREYAILARRGMHVDDVKAQMATAVRTAVIPGRGNVPFAARLLEPPTGIASFLPYLRTFDPRVVFQDLASQEQQ
jgi:predicted Zn finger-like uncharacterized protein